MTAVCLAAKHNVICQFLWDPIHYAFHGVLVEASDCSASIRGNMVTPLGHLSIRCDLPLYSIGLYMSDLSNRYNAVEGCSQRYSNILRKYVDTITLLNSISPGILVPPSSSIPPHHPTPTPC